MKRARVSSYLVSGALALGALSTSCAEDRILEPEPSCGNDRVEGTEQCDVQHEGCVECRVVNGFTCNRETCATTCGDRIIAGKESCDPPDPVDQVRACDSSCQSASKAEDCDMTGYWITRETDFSIDNIVSQIQTSSNFYFYHITQTGVSFEVDQSLFCGVQVSGSVDVTISPGGMRGLIHRNPQDGTLNRAGVSHAKRRGTFVLDGATCAFTMERFYNVRGVEDRFLPADFAAKPELDSLEALPTVDDPKAPPPAVPGATDDDGDTFAGIAWLISGTTNGTRNTAQRDHNEYFTHPQFPIVPRAIEFVAMSEFNNQENILQVSQCPRLGCGLLLGKSKPAGDRTHRITFRFLGKTTTEARVSGVVVGEPRKSIEDDLRTCAKLRALLAHDPAKQ